MNQMTIIGNLVCDPSSRFLPDGKAVTSFSVAVQRDYADRITGKKEADFFDVVCFSKLAEICAEYLSKGKKVYVCGPYQRKPWTNYKGEEKSGGKINAEKIEFLSPREDDGFRKSAGAFKPKAKPVADDDIRLNEVDETDIDTELERNQPYGF